jgi:hypothetical protein
MGRAPIAVGQALGKQSPGFHTSRGLACGGRTAPRAAGDGIVAADRRSLTRRHGAGSAPQHRPPGSQHSKSAQPLLPLCWLLVMSSLSLHETWCRSSPARVSGVDCSTSVVLACGAGHTE